jgi:hypothetical protein
MRLCFYFRDKKVKVFTSRIVQLQRLAPRDVSVRPLKSKGDFSGRPSEAHDVLDPPATGRGALRRATLVGADQGACAFHIEVNTMVKLACAKKEV